MSPRRVIFLVLAALALVLPGRASFGQGLEYVKAHYTKYEYRIPMRDGVHLFTSVYVPKDSAQTYPIMLNRTPYSVGPYGVDKYRDTLGPSAHFGTKGYIVALQDVRGRYMSEGTFADVRPQIAKKRDKNDIDESSDTYDTIEWLINHVPRNNRRVGVWGISYPGFYAAAAVIDAHPALKAASPQAPLVDWFIGDDVHHNGAFFLHQTFNFDAQFGAPRTGPTAKPDQPFHHGTNDAYAFFLNLGPLARANELYFKGQRAFWNEEMKHGNYDQFWKERALWPHLVDVKPAVLTVGGWFDAEDLYGPLKTHRTIEANHPRSHNTLVMGPWVHGGWSRGDGASLGSVAFASKTGEFYRERIEFAFFEHYLREAATDQRGESVWKSTKAWVFETGKNEWHRHDAWPPKDAKQKKLYLAAKGKISFDPPSQDGDGFDEFPSDPAHPVPYTTVISSDYPASYMVEDQRFASRRPDVVTYQTEPFESDFTIAGPIEVDLRVSTTGTDADWVVKLIDVYPDDAPTRDPKPAADSQGGFQQLVRGDVMRGKFRNSLEKPEPFKPGEPTTVKFTIPDSYHSFRSGHRLMVQVQSSWFPLVDRNPQTFVDIYSAKESDFQKATHRVLRTADQASVIEVMVTP